MTDVFLTRALRSRTTSTTVGLSDSSEAQLAAFGFDWQTKQTELVNTLFGNASQAGLYTTDHVQALNVDVPLLTRTPNCDFIRLLRRLEGRPESLPDHWHP